MIVEICLSVISVSFLVLVIALIIALRSSSRKLSQMQEDLSILAADGSELLQNLSELTDDLKKKSEALNFAFQFLEGFNKEDSTSSREERQAQKNAEKMAEIVDIIGTTIGLFNRIKGDIKKYVKSR